MASPGKHAPQPCVVLKSWTCSLAGSPSAGLGQNCRIILEHLVTLLFFALQRHLQALSEETAPTSKARHEMGNLESKSSEQSTERMRCYIS